MARPGAGSGARRRRQAGNADMTDKFRHVVRLDDDLSRRLEQLAPGQSKSALIGDALRAWFSRESSLLTAPAIDPVLRTRLDHDSRRDRKSTRLNSSH